MNPVLKAFLLLFVASSPALSQEIEIVSRHSDFSISKEGKIQRYILLRSDQDLVLRVKGPMFLNIKFRGLIPLEKKGMVTFTLSYLRDGGFRSINTYEVRQEKKGKKRKVDVITEGTLWVTEHRWIQIKVPAGEHIYQVSRPVELPNGLILKVYKANKENRSLLASPESSEIPIASLPPPVEQKRQDRVIIAERVEKVVPPVVEEKREVIRQDEKREIKYFSCAVKANILVPTSRVDSTYALSLDLKYISPLLSNRLSFGVEAGYYPLSGGGKNMDPQIGLYDYSFSIINIPIFIGAEYLLPVKGVPIGLFVDGGGAILLSYSTSKTFGGENYANGVAYGYYVGGGAQISPGYGYIISELRFLGAYLKYDTVVDLGSTGNIGGTSFYIGYKLVF